MPYLDQWASQWKQKIKLTQNLLLYYAVRTLVKGPQRHLAACRLKLRHLQEWSPSYITDLFIYISNKNQKESNLSILYYPIPQQCSYNLYALFVYVSDVWNL